MLKFISNTAPALRFRRWSRAGYAIFRSLSRVVTIGKLQNDIANVSELKNGHTEVSSRKDFTDETDEVTIESTVFMHENPLLNPALFCTLITNAPALASFNALSTNNQYNGCSCIHDSYNRFFISFRFIQSA